MMPLTASNHYPAEVYPQIQPLFTRNSTLLHLVHLLFTFDVRKRALPGWECNSTHIPNGARNQQSLAEAAPRLTQSSAEIVAYRPAESATGHHRGDTSFTRDESAP